VTLLLARPTPESSDAIRVLSGALTSGACVEVLHQAEGHADPLFEADTGSAPDCAESDKARQWAGYLAGWSRARPIGAALGAESDWVKNVLAADGCSMKMSGRVLELTGPRLVTFPEASRVFPVWFRLGLRYLVRTGQCLIMKVTSDRSDDGGPHSPSPQP
jgi:hypothetical protein